MRTPSDALVGPFAVNALRAVNVDLVFLGVHGMHQRAGFTTPNMLEAETNQALIETGGRLVVVAETRETDSGALRALQEEVRNSCNDLLGMPPDEVVLATPHAVLKTSSGKIRRAAVRELFEQNRIGQRPRAVWLQVVRVALAGWRPRLRRASRWTVDRAYAAYAHAVFWLLAIPSWLLIVLLPGEGMRWAIMRRAARLLFLLTGVPMRVEGLEHWPRGRHCVIVANHASYLDGVLLKGYLPWRFSFVIKGEMRDFAPAHFLLRRAGAKLVERTDIKGSTRDARHIVRAAQAGESLGFFPEGTFLEEPGVGRFRPGAFVAAIKGTVEGRSYLDPAVAVAVVEVHGGRAVAQGAADVAPEVVADDVAAAGRIPAFVQRPGIVAGRAEIMDDIQFKNVVVTLDADGHVRCIVTPVVRRAIADAAERNAAGI